MNPLIASSRLYTARYYSRSEHPGIVWADLRVRMQLLTRVSVLSAKRHRPIRKRIQFTAYSCDSKWCRMQLWCRRRCHLVASCVHVHTSVRLLLLLLLAMWAGPRSAPASLNECIHLSSRLGPHPPSVCMYAASQPAGRPLGQAGDKRCPVYPRQVLVDCSVGLVRTLWQRWGSVMNHLDTLLSYINYTAPCSRPNCADQCDGRISGIQWTRRSQLSLRE